MNNHQPLLVFLAPTNYNNPVSRLPQSKSRPFEKKKMLLSTKRIVAQKSPLEVLAATFFSKIGMRCRQRRLMLGQTELRSVFFAQVPQTAGMSNVSTSSNRTT